MLRQAQEKVLHKLTKLMVRSNKEDKLILEEHFKHIAQGYFENEMFKGDNNIHLIHFYNFLDIKEDLCILTTVIQALWESLENESHQIIIIDILHHLYFPTVKPHLIHLLR